MAIPALIGAGASLLGGLFGRRSEKKGIAAQNKYNLPTAQRKRWEDAKMNPAAFIAPGSDIQTATGGQNYMGKAIADAGAIVAQSLTDRSEERKEINELRQENTELRKASNKISLRPTVPGIYGVTGGGTSFNTVTGEEILPEEKHVTEIVHTDDGPVQVPIGPDPEEIAAGWMIQLYAKNRAWREYKSKHTIGSPLNFDSIHHVMPPANKHKRFGNFGGRTAADGTGGLTGNWNGSMFPHPKPSFNTGKKKKPKLAIPALGF